MLSAKVIAVSCILLLVGQQPSFGGKKDRTIEAQESRIAELEVANQRLLSQVTTLSEEAGKQKQLSQTQAQMLESLRAQYRDCEAKVSSQVARQSVITPGAKEVFKAQVLLDSAFAIRASPYSDDDDAWEPEPDWISKHQSRAAFALLHITPELIDAAFHYWVAERRRTSAERRQELVGSLKRRFMRQGERTFLLVVKPVEATDYQAEWGLLIGDLKTAKLVAFNGKQGSVTKSEACGLNEPLIADSGTVSCLFFMQDVVNPETDPTFTVALGGVFHRIKLNSGPWARTREGQTVRFRFEPSPVKLVQLMEEGVPWPKIEEKYIGPRRRTVSSQAPGGAGDALLGLVADIVLKLIL